MNTIVEFEQQELETSVIHRFEKIVKMFPNRLAIKMQEQSINYDELNRAANRIAHAILARCGRRSEPIALLFEYGIAIFPAIFGVLKAGKFYVAMDPTFPIQRNIYMLNDSQSVLILTNTRNHQLAHELTTNGRTVLNIEEIGPDLSSDDLGLFVAPEDPLSIQYTSGSTGNPKGVLSDQELHRRLHVEIPISPDDKFSLLHSVSFGSATLNLFLSLLNGAALFPFDIKSEGIIRLSNWLFDEQITICHLPPTLFRQLIDTISDPEMLSHLRMITLSGSPITRRDFELYKDKCPAKTLLRFHMGASEVGHSFSAVVDRKFNYPEEGTPLGYPYPGKKVLLLDDNKRPVKPNQVGEIAIQTARLRYRYWNRPDLSVAKFFSDPNSCDKQITLTGDLGRMLPGGFVIHMGRKDAMVKIRGYRVELGEIESTLLDHPEIKDAGVVAWDREPGEKYLVAYIVPRQEIPPMVDELRRFLNRKLPDYMIPSTFVFLESLPLTNGKLDRAVLPKPGNERPRMGQPFTSPRNEVERKLAGIWAEVLGVDRVGIHDDFFDLGGHSLLASRLFVQIEKAFGKQLPVATLFHARSVEQLAAVIGQEGWTAPWSLLVPIQPSGSKPPFFWASGESSDFLLPKYLGWDQPLYALMHPCHDGKRARYTSLEDVALNGLDEIRTVQPTGPYYLGGSCFGGMVAFEMAQQLLDRGEQVALLALLDLATIKNCKFLVNRVSTNHESLGDEARRHLQTLATLKPNEKLKYVLIRIKDRINAVRTSVGNLSKQAVRSMWRVYIMLGRPVPLSLRLHYISAVDRKILRQYQPKPYPGRMIHFKAEGNYFDTELVRRLSCGSFENHDVPGGHLEVAKEPHVRVWAEVLKSYLSKAQVETSGETTHREQNARPVTSSL